VTSKGKETRRGRQRRERLRNTAGPVGPEDPSGHLGVRGLPGSRCRAAPLVVQVGATELRYHLRCIEDLHAMLAKRGDWMPLGNADEQKLAKPGTVEAWGRSADNPVGGWYGLKKGLRGRFGNYVPPVLEALGMAEVGHNPRNNRMRASNAYGRYSPTPRVTAPGTALSSASRDRSPTAPPSRWSPS
jgi:hypothetical protein